MLWLSANKCNVVFSSIIRRMFQAFHKSSVELSQALADIVQSLSVIEMKNSSEIFSLREEKNNINFYVQIKIKLLDTHSWWIDIMWCKFNEKSHGFLDYFCKDFVRNLEYSYGYHRVENRPSLIVLIVLSIKPRMKHNLTFWKAWTANTALYLSFLFRNSDYKLNMIYPIWAVWDRLQIQI